MKKFLIITGSILLGAALNTETSKKVFGWSCNKIKKTINDFVKKTNEVIDKNTSSKEETQEEVSE